MSVVWCPPLPLSWCPCPFSTPSTLSIVAGKIFLVLMNDRAVTILSHLATSPSPACNVEGTPWWGTHLSGDPSWGYGTWWYLSNFAMSVTISHAVSPQHSAATLWNHWGEIDWRHERTLCPASWHLVVWCHCGVDSLLSKCCPGTTASLLVWGNGHLRARCLCMG